jgi:DNA-binding MarR family transcriptional regulator
MAEIDDSPQASHPMPHPQRAGGETEPTAANASLDERGAAAWLGFLEAQRRVIDALDAFTKRSVGIAVEDFEVLSQLRGAPDGRLRMRDLAAQLCFSPSRLSHRIDRLHELGFVDREPVPGDRRGTFAKLTEFGHDIVARHTPGYEGAVRALLLDRLEPAELDALASGLPRVAQSLRGLDRGGPLTG